MSSNNPANDREFFEQFLADYYAESEEHLIITRRNLLSLEGLIANPTMASPILDELFRSFHTLKGISGMVGLSEAEHVAHQLESYLRALRQGEVSLDKDGIGVMMDGTTFLERLIAARRNEEAMPNIDGITARLNGALAKTGDERAVDAPKTSSSQPGNKSSETNAQLRPWTIIFTPSLALSERGLNVNNVRARLQEIGSLVKSTPLVRGEGEIAFEFVLKTDADASVFAEWDIENLSYELVPDGEEVKEQSDHADALSYPDDDPSLSQTSPMLASTSVVRVDLARLDELMRMIGELVSSRARLDRRLKDLQRTLSAADWRPLQETSLTMERQLRDLRQGVLRVRMVQIGEIFERMQFVVRDLARENEKEIKLEMSGQETEIDKFLVERMMGPLLHLVRNAVSHGLESPEERRAQGKSSVGSIKLSAEALGEAIIIQIADDGRGIDIDRVRARARERGLVTDDEEMDDASLLALICTPGFSTRDTVDRESGRGVGMDVVARAVQEVGGLLSFQTEKNKGTSFKIELPLTLQVAEALITMVGEHRFAVPQAAVREILSVDPGTIRVLENNEIIPYRGSVLPVVRLARIFGLEGNNIRQSFHVFVVGTGSSAMGIAVDRVVGQREIVIRGLKDPLVQMPGIAGATELGDERIVLILDVGALRRLATTPN